MSSPDSPIPVGRTHRTSCDVEISIYDYDSLNLDSAVLPAGTLFRPWEPADHDRGKEVPITLGDQATTFDWGVSSYLGHFMGWDDFFTRCEPVE